MASGNPRSKIFEPLNIANGKIKLKHRVVLAPLTRNRGVSLIEGTPDNPNRNWFPDELVAEYYGQRATDGGLLISEGLAPSLQVCYAQDVQDVTYIRYFRQVVCLEHQAFISRSKFAGWKKVVNAVHAKGGIIYGQLWHCGRTTIPPITGLPNLGPSGIPWDDPKECYPYRPPGHTEQVSFAEYPPVEMTVADIKSTIQDYCKAAKVAMEVCGFDGIEVHGGNGYLPEQFLSSNINKRTDAYGGSPEKRCEFTLELLQALANTVGEENTALRLSPFGLYNQARGEERPETWSYLCKELKLRFAGMSYISFIEPRYEQVFSTEEKDSFLASWGLVAVDLTLFRKIFGDTPFFSAGGWNDKNFPGVLETGDYDALLFGRWFISNPDLPKRLKEGLPLRIDERDRFYGPFPDRERGYTDYPTWEEEQDSKVNVGSLSLKDKPVARVKAVAGVN